MPTYLCHGFRWQRRSIRVYVVVQNLDDAAPEWIIRRGTARTLLESFYALFDFLPSCAPPGGGGGGGSDNRSNGRARSKSAVPARQQQQAVEGQVLHDAADDVLSQDWSAVKVLEEYDPLNLDEVSRPHAYVADYVARIDLSASIVDEMARYEERLRGDPEPAMAPPGKSSKRQGWLEKLRDQLQRGEDIRWYVVVNGDEERNWPDEPPARQERMAQAAREQRDHHAQYTLQQGIFEGRNRSNDKERERERLRYELSGDKDILSSDRDRERREQRPMVPEKDLPAMRQRMSVESGLRPKTPKAGGFRRLFGRNRGGEETP